MVADAQQNVEKIFLCIEALGPQFPKRNLDTKKTAPNIKVCFS